MKGRWERLGLAIAGVLVLAALAAPSAFANFVYWPNAGGTSLGRAGLDGSQLNNNFVPTTDAPSSVAVDSQYIYWTHGTTGTGAIGRAKLDGTAIDPNFIPHSAGVYSPTGIAVTATHIYWANTAATADIGRASIDGTQPNSSFIADPTSPCGLAVDKNFLYWSTNVRTAVARAPIGGGPAQLDFIPVASSSDCAVAVDASHVYWVEANGSFSEVARANIDGTQIKRDFITGVYAYGLAVTPQYIFWGSGYTDHSIGRANLDGTGPNEFFVTAGIGNAATPYLLAASPSSSFTLGKVKRKSNGTAVIKATVPGPGVLVADAASKGAQAVVSKKKSTIKRVQVTANKAGTFKLKVKAKGKALEKLNRTGKVTVKAGITFTPQGVAGTPSLQKKKVKLKRG
jgi:hypothetical protein